MVGSTEEEQIEAIKRWWSEYGTSTIIGVVVALAAVFGYQAWQNHVQKQEEAASVIYQQLLDAVKVDSPLAKIDKKNVATAQFLGKQLEDDYSGSTYADLGALYLAKLAVEAKDLAAAERELKWALSHGVDGSLKTIVKMRLARVQLGQGKPDDALRTLDGIQPGEYRPSYDELKGDVYHAMGDDEKAREAYERAMNALGPGPGRPMLQMKLDQLKPPNAMVPDKSPPSKAGSGSTSTDKAPKASGAK